MEFSLEKNSAFFCDTLVSRGSSNKHHAEKSSGAHIVNLIQQRDRIDSVEYKCKIIGVKNNANICPKISGDKKRFLYGTTVRR